MSSATDETVASVPTPRPGSNDEQLIAHFDLIGKVPDRVVAAKAGVSVGTVRNFRTHHGIQSSRPAGKPARKAKGGGKRGKAATPKEKGRPGRKSKIKPFHDLVGKVSDEELAKMAGASPGTVENYRRKHKIPPFAGDGAEAAPAPKSDKGRRPRLRTARDPNAPKGRPGRKSKIKPFHDLVGAVPDEEVAAKAGVRVEAIQAYRRKNKIAAYGGAAKPARAPKATGTKAGATKAGATKAVATKARAARKTAGASLWGWKITFAGAEARVVVASDAARAVDQASKAGLGDVIQIERLLEALS